MAQTHSLVVGSSVEDAQVHDHLCLFYEDETEQFGAIVPFFQVGLQRGERCIYVADDSCPDQVSSALERGGIDVKAARERGALLIVSKDDAYLRGGYFNPDEMFDFLTQTIAAAKHDGFGALRVTGEMTWVLGNVRGAERLLEYEARVNDFFRDHDIVAICQYSRKRFDPDMMKEVILTHPSLVFDGRVCENPYFVPPVQFLEPDRKAREVEGMFDNVRRHQAERDNLQRQGVAKDEFISFVSHELRSPVTTIVGFAELLARPGNRLTEATKREAITDIRSEAHRLARLLNDLIVLARFNSNQSLALRPVALGDCLQACVEDYRRIRPERPILISLGEGALAMGHEGYARQVITNLLSNADKYSSSDSAIEVTISSSRDGPVRVTVRDHGPGLLVDEIAHLFQPFYRGNTAIRKPGMGIGLTVCQRLVEAQSGRIWAENHAEGGAVFAFDLPAAVESATVKEPRRDRLRHLDAKSA